MSGNELVEIEVDYLHHTSSAVLVRDAKGREVWLPLTTVEYDGNFIDLDRGQGIKLQVQEWIATKQELI